MESLYFLQAQPNLLEKEEVNVLEHGVYLNKSTALISATAVFISCCSKMQITTTCVTCRFRASTLKCKYLVTVTKLYEIPDKNNNKTTTTTITYQFINIRPNASPEHADSAIFGGKTPMNN